MRRLAFFIAAFSVAVSAQSQSSIDSLKTLAQTAFTKGNNDAVANYYSQIGMAFLSRREYDSSATYYYQSLSRSANNSKLAASNYNALGVIYNQKGLVDSAVSFYNKALTIYREHSDTTNLIVMETNLAIIYKNAGAYEKALESVFSALAKLERKPADRALASAYNTVGTVYAKMDEHLNALRYYQKALEIRIAIGYEKGIGQSFNNIGEAYIGLGMYDSALTNLLKSNAMKAAQNDVQGAGVTMNLIGEILIRQKRYEQAKPYLLQVVRIKKTSEERLDQVAALHNLATAELALGQLSPAAKYLDEAAALIKESNALDPLKQNLELKVQLFKAKNDPGKALTAMEQLQQVKDSLLNADKIKSLQALQAQYETEQKEQQISLLEKEQALQQAKLQSTVIWNWGLVITVALLAIIILLVYSNFRALRKNKMRIEILLRELHHRVKNNLQLLSSIFSLQSQELTDERAIQAVRSSEGRINAMALIHRKLYNVEQNRTIRIKDYVKELVEYLTYAYGFNDGPLAVTTKVTDLEIDVDKAIPLGLILNELLSNSFKYAFNGHPDPRLNVRMSVVDNQLQIVVADNGIGIDKTRINENDSFGLKMIGTLIGQLNGTIETETDAGTSYSLMIPMQ